MHFNYNPKKMAMPQKSYYWGIAISHKRGLIISFGFYNFIVNT